MTIKNCRVVINDFYSTHDLALATAVSLFYPIDSIDKTNPNKAIFVFKRDKNLDQLIELYWKGEMRVNPLSYFAALKNIKARLYAQD